MDVFGTGPRIEDAITVYIRQFRGIGKGSRALAMDNDYARATVRARRRGAVAAAGPTRPHSAVKRTQVRLII